MALTRHTDVMTLHGMEALQAALKTSLASVRLQVGEVVALTTFAIGQRMRATVARDSGRLAANISTSFRGLTGRVEIGVDAFYWHFLEYGTRYMAARPFARPAAEAESGPFEQRLQLVARNVERDFSHDMARAA